MTLKPGENGGRSNGNGGRRIPVTTLHFTVNRGQSIPVVPLRFNGNGRQSILVTVLKLIGNGGKSIRIIRGNYGRPTQKSARHGTELRT
jgi:hypothetical protein